MKVCACGAEVELIDQQWEPFPLYEKAWVHIDRARNLSHQAYNVEDAAQRDPEPTEEPS